MKNFILTLFVSLVAGTLLSTTLFEGSFALEASGVIFAGSMIAANFLPSVEAGVLQMAICPTACAPTLPSSYSGGCGIISRPGGIRKFAFIKCDYTFTDISDPAEWTTAIANGDVIGSGLVLAQKPKGSFTKKRIASCEPEAVVGAEKSITFQDYNTDTVTGPGGVLHYDFWNTILQQPQNFLFAYYTCDQYLTGPVTDFQLEIDEVIEDNDTGNTYFDGTITWNDVLMNVPTQVNLDGIL